jgi:hypothetical protein
VREMPKKRLFPNPTRQKHEQKSTPREPGPGEVIHR